MRVDSTAEIDSTAETIPAALVRAARRFPDHEAVVDETPVDGPVRMSYAELHDRVRRCAALLAGHGIAPGDRVALCSPNTHHWVVAALGALYAGATLVPVNTRFTGPEMRDVVARSEARALVVAGPFLGVDRLAELRAAGLSPQRAVLRVPVEGPVGPEDGVLDWAEVDRADPTGADGRAAAVGPDDVSDILFTSGTTGRSKGAMTSHRRSLGVAAAWAERGGLRADDRYLVINPFFHSFGYKAGILAALLRGATLLPHRTFDVAATLRAIETERVTVLPGAPTIYSTLLDAPERGRHDLSSLRLAVTGAATVPVVLVERMRTDLGFDTVLTAYGLTEAVVATMCHPDDDPETVARTAGRAAAGFTVRIAEGTGEVLLRGPNTMLGYLDDPEATATAIDADGWLHTGDVGVLDERGYLTITDRIKDMYICGGFNVYPAEVEQALARLDGVAESAVVGVADARLGEVGKAFVVRRPGSRLADEDVLAHCRRELANFKVPRHVEFRTELPRNAAGKVLKRVLRERER
ncbi:Acyl-CoA synthetase (AMP-forming)/AMP-acid ligase II [Amycolatopsis arida]|uniref:Acyl-CoA synthetase (AMP-forming)/AMP-acid ligase II n=1 Tax=Amycolatopsis arida TaxID=587909 RepID=A0A1I5VP23_9PSEU|nr:FadD3 family acyl-CoA ligase [Amycolatopsis arida]TDX87972.1 acyl-CoA synthetase (AMP-forming)/AMP-acid ligase II [Amycolatopsis arida]SFQ09193.1 Acyl-CoA synthetase (AMP-forming)/AMP-acid ligase II [Amycolatopsis arida]